MIYGTRTIFEYGRDYDTLYQFVISNDDAKRFLSSGWGYKEWFKLVNVTLIPKIISTGKLKVKEKFEIFK